MGNNASVPQVRAKDLKRVCEKGDKNEKRCGWLFKAGLTNTKLQRRWCAVHDLHLYYYETPRDEEPKGVVNLRGAIISMSKRVNFAVEIETGALISEKGIEKRTYFFTPVDPDAGQHLDEFEMKKQRKENAEQVKRWYQILESETAKTFTPK